MSKKSKKKGDNENLVSKLLLITAIIELLVQLVELLNNLVD